MKPSTLALCLVPLFLALLASLVWADESNTRPTGAERARLYSRDRGLIETLVQEGLRLAQTDDPLKRADCCNGMARHLAHEIQDAATHREGNRVSELGHHLHAVLKNGVAANLISACDGPVPPTSTFEKDLREVHKHTVDFLQPLEDQLRDLESQVEVRHTLQVVSQGRAEVDRVVKKRPHASLP